MKKEKMDNTEKHNSLMYIIIIVIIAGMVAGFIGYIVGQDKIDGDTTIIKARTSQGELETGDIGDAE